jgi:hypothetical protein
LDQRIFRRNPKPATTLNQTPLFSKYNSALRCTCSKKRTSKPTVEFLKDSIAGNKRYLKLRISPNRVNRYDILPIKKWYSIILKLMAQLISIKRNQFNRKEKKLLSYYVVDNAPLEMEFNINIRAVLIWN